MIFFYTNFWSNSQRNSENDDDNSVCVFQYMEEFAELLVPVTDPRHKAVELVVQHLAASNKDIHEVSDVTWSVHVVQSPNINAFVLPVSEEITCRHGITSLMSNGWS